MTYMGMYGKDERRGNHDMTKDAHITKFWNRASV